MDGNVTGAGWSMKENISLGDFAAGEGKSLVVKLSLSEEMDNQYQSLLGRVNWVFSAQGAGKREEDPDGSEKEYGQQNSREGNSQNEREKVFSSVAASPKTGDETKAAVNGWHCLVPWQQWRSAAGGCTERKARMNKRYPKAMCLIILSGMLICFCYPQILKMRCYTVVSGSMSPALPVGAAVYVKEKQPREIKKGEIITFFEGETVITHRVMEIDENAQLFMTKGDANEKQDTQPVKWENVYGTVVFTVPYVGYVRLFLGTWNGKAAVLSCFLAFSLCMNIWEGVKAKRSVK